MLRQKASDLWTSEVPWIRQAVVSMSASQLRCMGLVFNPLWYLNCKGEGQKRKKKAFGPEVGGLFCYH